MIVSVYVPVAVFFAVETLKVDVPELEIELGLNVAEALGGTPLTFSAIVPLNPFTAAAETL